MESRELLVVPTPIISADLTRSERPGGALRAERVHRYLVARLRSARHELRELEARREAPAAVVAWVGSLVSERQREVEARRAEGEARAEALVRAAEERVQELVGGAESEARALRAVAVWLRQLGGAPADPVGPLPAGAGSRQVEAGVR
jgi:hypothetical protein